MKNKLDKKFEEGMQCPDCKYFNQYKYLKKSGVCHLCGKVLDPKAKFDYEMFTKLRLWRKK